MHKSCVHFFSCRLHVHVVFLLFFFKLVDQVGRFQVPVQALCSCSNVWYVIASPWPAFRRRVWYFAFPVLRFDRLLAVLRRPFCCQQHFLQGSLCRGAAGSVHGWYSFRILSSIYINTGACKGVLIFFVMQISQAWSFTVAALLVWFAYSSLEALAVHLMVMF